MLAALAARRPIDEPVALVVAHPDDETLAAGGSMHLMRRLLLVHVTDGAPRNLADAAREGHADPQSYARAREDELARALSLSGADPARKRLEVPDQEAIAEVGAITKRLTRLLRDSDIRWVLTHTYEGGHPDHDAVALAAHATGAEIFEFPGYHAGPSGGFATGFLPASSPAISVALPPPDLSRKRTMLDCFRSQAEILSRFDIATEHFRRAPRYDFTRPPSAGRLLYEEWGWMTGDEWRRLAARRCAG